MDSIVWTECVERIVSYEILYYLYVVKKYRMSGGLFQSLGYTKTQRMAIFFLVCIWVRFTLAYLVHRFHERPIVKIMLGSAALISFIVNIRLMSSPVSSDVWWCRDIHALCAGLIFSSILLGYSSWCAPIMVVDTLIGILTAVTCIGLNISFCPVL